MAVDEVTLWKAPQPGRDGAREVVAGFDPQAYPGKGPYFALDEQLAREYQSNYQNGLQELYLPQSLFDDLVRQGVIVADPFYPGRSCHVPSGDLPRFNEAIKHGTPNVYHPEGT